MFCAFDKEFDSSFYGKSLSEQLLMLGGFWSKFSEESILEILDKNPERFCSSSVKNWIESETNELRLTDYFKALYRQWIKKYEDQDKKSLLKTEKTSLQFSDFFKETTDKPVEEEIPYKQLRAAFLAVESVHKEKFGTQVKQVVEKLRILSLFAKDQLKDYSTELLEKVFSKLLSDDASVILKKATPEMLSEQHELVQTVVKTLIISETQLKK